MRLRRLCKWAPRTGRARPRAVAVRGAVAGLPLVCRALASLTDRQPLQPLPSLCWSRASAAPAAAGASDAAANLPAPALRSLEAPLVRVYVRRPRFAAAGVGVCRHFVRLRRFVLKGCPLPPPLPPFSGRLAMVRKLQSDRRSRQEACRRRQGQ